MSSPPSSPTPQKGSVRSMISIFENQTVFVNNEPTNLVRRAKSMVNLSYTRPIKKERIEPEKNLELTQIEQQIQHLQNKLSNNYRVYSRENHIYYQNQIIFILTDLANVETRGNPKTIDKKSELTEILKRLNKKLNVVLPSEEGEVVTKTVKYDKFGMRSKSSDDERYEVKTNKKEVVEVKTNKKEAVEVKTNKKEAVQVKTSRKELVKQRSEEKVATAVQRHEEWETEIKKEKEDEVDSLAVSVRSLKQIFEKNTTENEGKPDFGYVPYSQRFKSQEVNGREPSIEKQNSFDTDSSTEHLSTVWKVTPASDDENGGEKRGDFTPDSLTNEGSGSSSSGDSDSEKTAKEDFEE